MKINLKNLTIVFLVITISIIVSVNISKKKINSKISKLEEKLSILERINQKRFKEELVDLLKTYKVFDKNEELEFIRLGKEGDGGYIVIEKSLKEADILLGYGVCNDISFEEEFSNTYNKQAYGFDCTSKNILVSNKLTKFVPECIVHDNPNNKKEFSSFKQELNGLSLINKKLFIKMDIEGNEFEVFDDILSYASQITGIVMELHTNNNFDKSVDLLHKINRDFYLVNIHGNNCWGAFYTSNSKGDISDLLQLTYINKNLVDKVKVIKEFIHPSKLDTPNCNNKGEHHFKIYGK